MAKEYNASDIEVLSGLEPVQKRPGMYTDTDSPNHLAYEVIDNSVDEAIAGYCKSILSTMEKSIFMVCSYRDIGYWSYKYFRSEFKEIGCPTFSRCGRNDNFLGSNLFKPEEESTKGFLVGGSWRSVDWLGGHRIGLFKP